MSVISTAGSYGGKVSDNQQGIKQFFVSSTIGAVNWIFKTADKISITPSVNRPVYFPNDLYVQGSIYTPSDQRCKDNVDDISVEQTVQLMSLNPIHFTYKFDKRNIHHFGLMAQEVEQVFPELVSEGSCGLKTVNYQELIPLMLSKMKHMQYEIDELKERL